MRSVFARVEVVVDSFVSHFLSLLLPISTELSALVLVSRILRPRSTPTAFGGTLRGKYDASREGLCGEELTAAYEEQTMPVSPVEVHVFGGLEIRVGDRSLRRFPTRKSRSLFAFLVLHLGRHYNRDHLAGMFWGDQSSQAARGCLRTEVWRLRKILRDKLGLEDVIRSGLDTLALEFEDGAMLDFQELENCSRLARDCQGDEKIRLLEKAVGLYRGDLLEGLDESWCEVARERLRTRFVSAMDQLMQHAVQQGDWETAIGYGDRILQLDPVVEHVHQAMMWCYWKIGDRSAAMRRYALCRQMLERELDLEPMPETTALYQAIRLRIRVADDFDPFGRGALAKGEGANGMDRVAELNEIQDHLARAVDRLQHAIRSDPGLARRQVVPGPGRWS